MKNWLFILCAGVFTFSAAAQKRDSLLRMLQQTNADTVEVDLLLQTGTEFGITSPDSALLFFKEAEKLSRRLSYTKGVLQYYVHLTNLYNEMGKFDTALLLTAEAVLIARQQPNKILLARSLTSHGNSFLNIRRYDSAAHYYLRAETELESVAAHRELMILYTNMCGFYAEIDQPEKGKEYGLKALDQINKGKGDLKDMYFACTNLGAIYLKQHQFDSAYYYMNRAVSLSLADKNYYAARANLQNLLYAKVSQGDYQSLLPVAQQVSGIASLVKTPEFDAFMNLDFAIAYFYTGNPVLAKTYAQKAFHLCEANHFENTLKKVCTIFNSIEIALGNYRAADQYQEKRDSIQSAQLNKETLQHVQELEKKYQSQRKDNELLRLQAANRQKAVMNKVFLGVSVALLLIALLGYALFIYKRKVTTQQIAQLEKDKQILAIDSLLKGQEEERSRIAKDLHDGLGGLLSGTKMSFMNVKENLALSPQSTQLFEKSLTMLDNTISDLRKVAHNLMPEALVRFGLREVIRDYCETIQAAGTIQVVYQVYGNNREPESTARIFIYRIVQELVNNAVKHADPSRIIVQLMFNETDICITVEDNGVGFDMSMLSGKEGVGMANIEYRVKYFNGTIDIDSGPGNGSCFSVKLIA